MLCFELLFANAYDSIRLDILAAYQVLCVQNRHPQNARIRGGAMSVRARGDNRNYVFPGRDWLGHLGTRNVRDSFGLGNCAQSRDIGTVLTMSALEDTNDAL